MPKARLPFHSRATGPERIGAALNERWHEISGQAIGKAKARLDKTLATATQAIIDAAYEEGLSDQEGMSHDEKRKLAVALRTRIGQPATWERKCGLRAATGLRRPPEVVVLN